MNLLSRFSRKKGKGSQCKMLANLSRSYAESANGTCPNCRHAVQAEVWLIVDSAERPDLLERIRDGRLHEVSCPACGALVGEVDAPLILYRPGQMPQILFSPAQDTTSEERQDQASGLLFVLRERLGAEWREEWLEQGLLHVPRAMLPAVLSGNVGQALRERQVQVPPEIETLEDVLNVLTDSHGTARGLQAIAGVENPLSIEQQDESGPVEPSQSEKFAWVTSPAQVEKAGFDLLVRHTQFPRFIGRVDLQMDNLKIVEGFDDLDTWARAHPIPGKSSPQAAAFELIAEMISWARANQASAPKAATIWSPLPKRGFFGGKAAAVEDMKPGGAYFVLEDAKPIDIAIPQYAYGIDSETNEPFPCIILQAEEDSFGHRVVAYLNLRTKQECLGNLDSFVLLGQETPRIQLASLASPPYERAHEAMKNLSALVSCEVGVGSKRDCVRDNQELINTFLREGLAALTPLESFTLLDGAKSLVSRDLLLRKRAVNMGLSEPSIMRHGIDVDETCSVLEDDPETCVFSLYQSPDEEFFGYFLFMENSEIRAEHFPIATGVVGHRTAQELRELALQKMWAVPKETERLLFPLLELFGESVIPRIQRLKGPRKLILIPHRWTHILPLHLMMVQNGNSVLSLDDVVTGTTFASSLTAFKWSYKSHLATVPPDRAKLALICVDVEDLGKWAQFELTAYRNMFADARGVDIVTAVDGVPADLSVYPVMLWSSHGISDPTRWERNRLMFQSEIFSAERISNTWDLRTTFVAILAACQTGIDLSVDEALDEYYGLDMALQIAGCSTVASTMWRAEDAVAGYTAVQLLEGVFAKQPLSLDLRVIRHLLRSGDWNKMVQMAYHLVRKDTSVAKERRAMRLETFEYLLSLPKDAFAHPSQWGVFRTFGRW